MINTLNQVLKPNLLELWLTSKDPKDIVGYSNHCNDCPLATYIRETINLLVTVTPHYIYQKEDILDLPRVLPEWATLFIKKIDNRCNCAIESQIALDFLQESIVEIEN